MIDDRALTGDFPYQPPHRVIGERGRRIGRGGVGPAVQRIVLERRLLILAVGELTEVPRWVVSIGLGATQRIFPRLQPIHVVVGVRRGLMIRIRHGEEIAVRIVGEGGDLIERISDLRDAISCAYACFDTRRFSFSYGHHWNLACPFFVLRFPF